MGTVNVNDHNSIDNVSEVKNKQINIASFHATTATAAAETVNNRIQSTRLMLLTNWFEIKQTGERCEEKKKNKRISTNCNAFLRNQNLFNAYFVTSSNFHESHFDLFFFSSSLSLSIALLFHGIKFFSWKFYWSHCCLFGSIEEISEKLKAKKTTTPQNIWFNTSSNENWLDMSVSVCLGFFFL